MQLILPFTKKDRQTFLRCAIEIGFDEFVANKFIFTILDSDLDVFQLMYDDRISLLIYGWEICEIYIQNERNGNAAESYNPSKNLQTVIKWLSRYSLDLWLSTEWENCHIRMRMGLLYCMRRIKDVLLKVPEVALLNWEHMITVWDLRPWQQRYVNRFLKSNKQLQHSVEQLIEEIEAPASKEDIDYLRVEDILIILLRLVKMLDSFFMEGAKQLSMRVISAWNAVYERAKDVPNNERPLIPEEHKKCIVSICHVYLLAVYELDDNRGFVIDNMMNNIRFYHQSFLDKKFQKPLDVIAQLNFTPARFIALTCVNLNITINDFCEMYTCHTSEKNFSTLFGVISQSYISYILGNQLMEMNAVNTDCFNANLESYKRILNLYLEEREASEMFCKDQLHRQQLQRNSHTASRTMKNLTDFASKFCKGNRPNNIGNCENTEEDQQEDQSLEAHTENAKKIDPVFQNIPNNEKILKHVYEMLANRTFDGWHFAKTILLFKIIGHEVNQIETWRYHPGLTTEFMLNLDIKLSKHYEDLAIIFQEYYFLEQEFWLTAFYLNPIRKYYDAVMRCGGRFYRRQNQADEIIDTPKNERHERGHEKHIHAKYGLLSSTIDIKEIVKITDHDKVNADYDALTVALDELKLPGRLIRDLLTVTFLPRNKNYAWAVNWQELRKRCKKLLKYPEYKRNLVELNMAEANDHLKYLKIDYDKYKHRPQLDYGSIELGYENVMNTTDQDDDSDDDDDDDDDDLDDDENDNKDKNEDNGDDNDDKNQEDVDHSDSDDEESQRGKRKRGRRRKKPDESLMRIKELELIADICSTGTRRTRAGTAAALATARESEKIKENEKNKEKEIEKVKEETEAEAETETEVKVEVDQPPDSSKNIPVDEKTEITELTTEKRNLNEFMLGRPFYSNITTGFQAYPDIWDFDSKVLQAVDVSCAILPETENLLHKFSTWTKYADGSTIHTEENKPVIEIKDELIQQIGDLIRSDVSESIVQETTETTAVEGIQNKDIDYDITVVSAEESPQHSIDNSMDRNDFEKDAIAVEIEKEIEKDDKLDGNIVEAISIDQQINQVAEENISNNLDPEENYELMSLETDETIAVEEVIIEEKDDVHNKIINREKNETTIPKELRTEEENNISEPEVKAAEQGESKDNDDIKDGPVKIFFEEIVDDKTEKQFPDDNNLQYDKQLKDDDQLKSDEQLNDDEQLKIDDRLKDDQLKNNDHLKNDQQSKIEDVKLKDDDELQKDDQLRTNDQLKHNKQDKDENLLKDAKQVKDDNQLKDDDELKKDKQLGDKIQTNAERQHQNEQQTKDNNQHKNEEELKNDRQLDDKTQTKDDNQLKDDDQLKNDIQLENKIRSLDRKPFKDGEEIRNNDVSSQDQIQETSNESREQEKSNNYIKVVNDDVHLDEEQGSKKLDFTEKTKCFSAKLNDGEKSSSNFEVQSSNKSSVTKSIQIERSDTNIYTECENSAETDCTKIDKSKTIHDGVIQTETKSQLTSTDEVNEYKKLDGPSIESDETIETVLKLKDFGENNKKADEKANSNKIVVNSLDSFIKAEDDKIIEVESRISNDNLTEYVIESTSNITTAILDDDNSTNMSNESFFAVKKEDNTVKSDKDDDEELCRKFSVKNSIIRIKRLTVNDLSQLRQPCIKLRRLELEQNIPQKRSMRNVEHKSYIGLDDSSKSSNDSVLSLTTQKTKAYVKHKLKRKFSRSPTSLSSDDEEVLRPVKTSRPQTARKRQQNIPSDRLKGRQKKLIVTPRSASGLKMRISSAPSKKMHDSMELIQISSSSSSSQTIEPSGEDEYLDPTTFVNACLAAEPLINNDPLYEELILFD